MKDLLHGFVTTVRSPRQGAQLPVVRQFVKFSIVGVMNTLTSTAVYLLATRRFGLHPLVAYAISFVVAVTVSYVLNKRWTFRDHGRDVRRQYATFFSVSFGGFLISELLLFLIHTVAGVHDLVAFAAAVVVSMLWNFSANRAWTFRVPRGLP